MELSDVIAVLQAGNQPDDKVLLDDGDYFIEHNCNYPLERGNGFLQRRCAVSITTPGGWECIGGYQQKLSGQWQADVNAPLDPVTDSDCRQVGMFADRLEAIAALWLARHEALSTHH